VKILHVITRLIQGGAQRDTVMKCEALVRAGHEVWLAYGPIYGPEGSMLDAAMASGAELVELKAMRRAVLPVHDVMCYAALRRLIRRIQPDIVHTHSSKAGIIGRAAGWHCKVGGVVHTIHGLAFHDRQNRIVHDLYVRLERWAARRCHRMIAITHAMQKAFEQQGIGQTDQFVHVPDGVDVSQYKPQSEAARNLRKRLGIAAGAPVVGIVARLDPLKGHADLIEILPHLLQSHPDARLLLVGDGWNRSRLKQQVRDAGVADQVVFEGLIPPQDVPAAMSAMDVMALPSYQEGQGLVLVEALLCGCAIVAYDVGGIGEICINEKTGRLDAVGDKQALLKSLLWMLSHPDERRRLTEQGRRHVCDQFDQKNLVVKLMNVYEQMGTENA
jgi:glycosyltransferase involved in cell wall biosynthesis